jgi:predicted aspartyl protease
MVNTMQPNTALVRALLNNKPVNCLIDTGASLSIVPSSIVSKIGTKRIPTDTVVTSASGHEISIESKAHVDIEIAGHKLSAIVCVVNDSHLNKHRDYQLIIGCDMLKKLPPLAIDFNKGKVILGDKSVCLGTTSKNLAENIKIQAVHSLEIKPGTHKLVKAKLDSCCELGDVIAHTLDKRLADEQIALVPAVYLPKNGEVNIVLTNPTNAPKHIHAGMHIAMANEVKESDHGPWLEESKAHSILAVQEQITADPTFKINFEKSSVT